MRGGMKPIVRRLLSLSGGIHFQELALKWFYGEDPSLTMALLEKCSHTLESLKVACDSPGTSVWHLCLRDDLHLVLVLAESGSTSIDLSKARKLKRLVFLSEEPSAQWIITVLKTITPDHQNLQQISLHVPSLPRNLDRTIDRADPANIRSTHGETSYRQDRKSTRLNSSHI